MYELQSGRAADLLRELADAIDRGRMVTWCDVSIEGISPDTAPEVALDIQIEADKQLLDEAGRYFDAHAP